MSGAPASWEPARRRRRHPTEMLARRLGCDPAPCPVRSGRDGGTQVLLQETQSKWWVPITNQHHPMAATKPTEKGKFFFFSLMMCCPLPTKVSEQQRWVQIFPRGPQGPRGHEEEFRDQRVHKSHQEARVQPKARFLLKRGQLSNRPERNPGF